MRWWIPAALLFAAISSIQPAVAETHGCTAQAAPLPANVPALEDVICATSPNLPAEGQPYLQNLLVRGSDGKALVERYTSRLQATGWKVVRSLEKSMPNGKMYLLEAGDKDGLTAKLMVHDHGATHDHHQGHHANTIPITLAVQQAKARTAR